METATILILIVLGAGALQGVIYGSILWRNHSIHRLSFRFLAGILLFFSYRLIVEILHYLGWGTYEDPLYYILLEFNWIYGALIYFFVRTYVNPAYQWQKKDWIHFIPVGIETVWSFFIKAQNFYWDGTRESLSWLGYWGYVIWVHHPTMILVSAGLIIYYGIQCWRLLNNPPDVHGYKLIPHSIQWIKRVIIVLMAFTILFMGITLIDWLFFDFAFNTFNLPIFIGMAAITYWLGLEGFSRRNTPAFKVVDLPSDEEMKELQTLSKRLDKAMKEDQLYKNPNLHLRELAQQLQVKPYILTRLFSVVLNTKFNDYINGYRLDALKELMKDPDNKKLTLLSLAFEVGFNSKASFNRATVKLTGRSPKHLLDE
ncbi:helix-turn-helix domain-containing protein [Aureitalea marina]|uniref:AraC family transcriptional regulator n=1 Tax=Aureitalea marina TaxID=930804 RepID=A0A2S7KLP6_9FLAO|nr:helix-turn-helix transcriptional regulator [Aureitalea marina]PQB03521.1 AraC family transcriptional regulator [Aureitalea marina]